MFLGGRVIGKRKSESGGTCALFRTVHEELLFRLSSEVFIVYIFIIYIKNNYTSISTRMSISPVENPTHKRVRIEDPKAGATFRFRVSAYNNSEEKREMA